MRSTLKSDSATKAFCGVRMCPEAVKTRNVSTVARMGMAAMIKKLNAPMMAEARIHRSSSVRTVEIRSYLQRGTGS